MSSVINIRGTTAVDDPEYRYKMPSIMGKVEGRGNGIKTAIPNITQVALSLHREPGEVCKFFGTELGAQTIWSPETERAIVNGAHTTADLQTNLFKYIEKFVLCPGCKLPETIYKVKSDCIYSTCAACGTKEMLDMTHKLTVYILAQDKKRKKEKKDKEKKEGKKDKKDKVEHDDDDEKKKKKKKKDKKDGDKDKDKKKKKKKDKKEKDAAEEDANSAGSDDDDDEDDAEEAAGEEPASASDEDAAEDGDGEGGGDAAGVAAEALDDMTLSMTAKEQSVQTMQEYYQSPEGKAATPAEVVAKLRELQVGKSLMLKECAYIFVASALDEAVVKAGQIKARAPVLRALVATDANNFMARHLIGAIEDMFGSKHQGLAKAFPLVLKQLYDEDVLEEGVLLDWAKQGVTYEFSPQSMSSEQVKALRELAEPFVNWLEEADSEDDEDEE